MVLKTKKLIAYKQAINTSIRQPMGNYLFSAVRLSTHGHWPCVQQAFKKHLQSFHQASSKPWKERKTKAWHRLPERSRRPWGKEKKTGRRGRGDATQGRCTSFLPQIYGQSHQRGPGGISRRIPEGVRQPEKPACQDISFGPWSQNWWAGTCPSYRYREALHAVTFTHSIKPCKRTPFALVASSCWTDYPNTFARIFQTHFKELAGDTRPLHFWGLPSFFCI